MHAVSLPADVPDGVQLRLLDLDECGADYSDALGLLNAAERARHARYHHAADARRFALTRAALREWLGLTLRREPVQIAITHGAHGKPLLENGGLHFNIAHAGRYALLALSEAHPVGVDIERIDTSRPLADIASQALSKRELAHCAAHGFETMFYAIWTGKEAILKASGTGIDEGIQLFSVIPDEDVLRVESDLDVAIQAWRVTAPHGYAAALALMPAITPPA